MQSILKKYHESSNECEANKIRLDNLLELYWETYAKYYKKNFKVEVIYKVGWIKITVKGEKAYNDFRQVYEDDFKQTFNLKLIEHTETKRRYYINEEKTITEHTYTYTYKENNIWEEITI